MNAPVPPASSPRRVWLRAALAAAVVLLLALLLFRFAVVETPATPAVSAQAAAPAAPAVAAPANPGSEEAVVVTAQGAVERAHSGGAWVNLAVGDKLRADDAVRTGRGASAGLRIGGKSELAVAESTQLSIRELTREVHRLKLDKGRIKVDYQPDGSRVLRIESAGAGGVAETTSARFSVLSTGTTVAVATESGSVDLRAAGTTVKVTAGKESTAREGEVPAAPADVPVQLLLKVAAAAGSASAALCARVEGVAAPGTQVLVDGVPAEVGRDGRFQVPVLRDPKQKREVLVAMRDVSGREERRTIPCLGEPPESAIHDFSIRWRTKRHP